MDDISTITGKRIRSLRVNKELSQDALAEMAGMSVKHLGKIERGDVNASLQCLSALAEALEIPVRDILDAEHEQCRERLIAELTLAIPNLTARDLQTIYRLVKILGRS